MTLTLWQPWALLTILGILTAGPLWTAGWVETIAGVTRRRVCARHNAASPVRYRPPPTRPRHRAPQERRWINA